MYWITCCKGKDATVWATSQTATNVLSFFFFLKTYAPTRSFKKKKNIIINWIKFHEYQVTRFNKK